MHKVVQYKNDRHDEFMIVLYVWFIKEKIRQIKVNFFTNPTRKKDYITILALTLTLTIKKGYI